MVGAAVAVAIAALAAAVAVGGVRHIYADLSAQAGLAALARAESLPPGGARDQALHEAQSGLNAAVGIAPVNASLWRALAETRHLQADASAFAGLSPELVRSTAEAAARAHALDPADALAAARLSQARMLLAEPPETIAGPLAQSYAREPISMAMAPWRPQVAFYAWPALAPAVQGAALLEACFQARETPERYAAMTALGSNPPHQEVQSPLLGMLKDVACQPVQVAQPPRPAPPPEPSPEPSPAD